MTRVPLVSDECRIWCFMDEGHCASIGVPSTGCIASSPPSGDTRKAQQEDLERRQDYAVAANVAFVAGGVFSAVAVVAFVWH